MAGASSAQDTVEHQQQLVVLAVLLDVVAVLLAVPLPRLRSVAHPMQ